MLLYDADSPSPNVMPVRMFIHERGGLKFDTQVVHLSSLENRGRYYRENVNKRGEMPALRLDDGQVITEITAICEYLDERASGGRSLIGDSAKERAVTRMWTRRVDLEIAEPIVAWWRGSKDAEAYYMGFRTLAPESQRYHRLLAEQGLNQLDEDLKDREYICGDRLMLADILLFGFMFTMSPTGEWIKNPNRKNVAEWFERMQQAKSFKVSLTTFSKLVDLPPAVSV